MIVLDEFMGDLKSQQTGFETSHPEHVVAWTIGLEGSSSSAYDAPTYNNGTKKSSLAPRKKYPPGCSPRCFRNQDRTIARKEFMGDLKSQQTGFKTSH